MNESFAVVVELLNLRLRSRHVPAPGAVQLRRRRAVEEAARSGAPAKAAERAWLLDPERAARSG